MLLAKEPKDVLVEPLKISKYPIRSLTCKNVFVARQMSIQRGIRCIDQQLEIHLKQIKECLETSMIPLGQLHVDFYLDRAMMKNSNERKLFDSCLDENNEDYEKRITAELLDKTNASKMHVHLQLCLISRKLNKVLKVQMSIEIVWYFYDALAACLLMYEMIIAYQYTWKFIDTFICLCVCFNFVLRTILFLTLHYICQTINETVAILHKLSSYNLDEDLRKQRLEFFFKLFVGKCTLQWSMWYFREKIGVIQMKDSNEGKLFDACLDENNEDYEKRITTELLDKTNAFTYQNRHEREKISLSRDYQSTIYPTKLIKPNFIVDLMDTSGDFITIYKFWFKIIYTILVKQ
ncbi:hypothetical protein ALC57_18777 [Trachymyrmex cornetzi]|uniref:Gustatory receptor n=1 Tax=Trachymyrmex cornetzi TaxID=471704 RepID=A0A151IR05_9HYME|nr:hypothetical protein ALC57_18777 [Trachymyrmex cornetzi]